MNRRTALKTLALAGTASVLPLGLQAQTPAPAPGPFVLPPLRFAPSALEPHIDAQTMTLHHDKHHGAYYLKYQNKRADYIAAFHNVIAWDYVSSRYRKV